MTTVYEEVEWQQLYRFDTSRSDLPRVLLIGDSIVAGYRNGVRDELSGKATVTAFSTSKCVGDPDLLVEVEYAMKHFRPAVIHFNNGLHGFTTTEAAYGRYLEQFVIDLGGLVPEAKLIWASSTPICGVDDAAGLDPVKNGRVVERNRLAWAIMEKHGIAVNDLYSAMLGQPGFRVDDQYHYNDAGQKFQAERVAAAIREYASECL